MSATNAFETAILEHIFTNNDVANIGDATGLRGSSSAGSLYLSLHTSDPGEAGNQSTNECTYGSYARVAVARSGAGFTVSGNSASLAANADFPTATSGTETATHFGVGTTSSGTGSLLFKGAISPNISISSGVTPRLTTSTAVTAD